MKKKNKNNDEFKATPPYTQVEQKLRDSEGFKHLKAHTKWLYVEFRLRYRGNNPRNITFTQKEAKEIMRIETFRDDYRKLIENGFIELIECGGFIIKSIYLVYLIGGRNTAQRTLSK